MTANDSLKQHTATDHYYQYISGMLLTDGVQALYSDYNCYWLADLVCSYQHSLCNEEFQVWELTKHLDNSATVICTDGNDNILKRQDIPFTDFKAHKAIVWVELNVLLLPSEH